MKTIQFFTALIAAISIAAQEGTSAEAPGKAARAPVTVLEQEREIITEQEIEQAAGAEFAKPLDPNEFIQEAVQSHMLTVKASRVALDQAQNPALRQLARSLVQDHTKILQELRRLSERKGIHAASDLDLRHQEKLNEIAAASGEAFDTAFARFVHRARGNDVRKFELMTAHTSDVEVQQFARTTLPTLRKHLLMARHFIPEVEHALEEIAEPAGAEQERIGGQKKEAPERDRQPNRPRPER
jgi:putative membrane protein